MTDNTLPAAIAARRTVIMRRKLLLPAVGVIAACIAAGFWWNSTRWQVSTDDAYARADIVTLAPKISGYIARVEVGDNQHVTAGQPLVMLEDKDYRARAEQAEAAWQTAIAAREVIETRIRQFPLRVQQQHTQITAAASRLQAAEVAEVQAQKGLTRQTDLNRQHISSAELLENARSIAAQATAASSEARAGLQQQQLALSLLQQEQQALQAESSGADAHIRETLAQQQLAAIDLQNTLIRSPVTGTIARRTVRPGELGEPGGPLLAVVPDAIYIIANFKETQMANIRPGQPATVSVDALNSQTFHGKVVSLAPASGAEFALLPSDNATGNFTKIVQRMPVRIQLTAGQEQMASIRPGMSVDVSVDTHHE
ncbi:HlyD family secretion protein [Tatumella citrea]|uniref:Uncharacterized protein n=1 Tax=Tatumella citrea TaxID=53336 RepID=A0A1Y0LPP0_TATCI|nr:HlyD family secretion protein [Tatumella citrea]ARU95942.1 hypothetical protein A7K98_20855 [Tatumella citrea]ARU99982.1 hypothetical protein A7K99_20840 [Tatumella citrea]